MEIIFKILCGILFCIGYLFGLSYADTSVIICIYLCPIVCMLAAFYAVCRTFKPNGIWNRILFSINMSLLVLYVVISDMFWEHYKTDDPFTLCMNDLKAIAGRMNMSYEEVNILIYCVLFFGIILFHLLTVMLRKKNNKKAVLSADSEQDTHFNGTKEMIIK